MTPEEFKDLLTHKAEKLQQHVDEWAASEGVPNGWRIEVSLAMKPAPMIPAPVPPEEIAETRAMLLREFYSVTHLFPGTHRWPSRLESESRNLLARATFGKPHFSGLTVGTFLERWESSILMRRKDFRRHHLNIINEHLLRHGLPEITGSQHGRPPR